MHEGETRWGELDGCLRTARGKPERLGSEGVRRLGDLYRGTAADLALARRRFPGDPATERLEDLLGRARPLVYDAGHRPGSLWGFLATGYWRRIGERPIPLCLAAALLVLSALLGWLWSRHDPGAAVGVLPGTFRGGTRNSTDLGLSASQQSAFAAEIFTNNIRVTFMSFAAGLLLGLGTAALLLFNGLTLGVVGGLAAGAGQGRIFAELVVPHGVLELSCIAVCGAAGMRIGWALVDPGPRPRLSALQAEARRGVEIVLGTIPWLVLAGLVEGFLTPRGLPVAAVLAIGLGLGALFWSLVLWRGRRPGGGPELTAGPAPWP